MDIKAIRHAVPDWLRRYRYPILIVIIGLVLMNLPTFSRSEEPTPVTTMAQDDKSDLAQELCEILSQIQGVGKVRVMLTVSAGEQTVYQTDDTIGDSSVRKETVIITTSDRAEQAVISQVLPESYRGAIVVCQGGDSAAVKLAVVDAVSKATGLGADSISVLKMK